MKPGDHVKLVTPDNPRLDGATARIAIVQSWGCHVLTTAASTGQFRASWDEMVPIHETNGHEARENGYTGDACNRCGGFRLRRTGTCSVCDDCGESGGCA